MLSVFLTVAASTLVLMLGGALALHVLWRVGPAGRHACEIMARAPALDAVLFYFTALPAIIGAVGGGWAGFFGALAGQAASLFVWCWAHEFANRKHAQGPRIVKVLNASVGKWNNHLALWWMAWAIPTFWGVRFAEYVVYPVLVKLVKLPPLKNAEWVNLSRQKFEGLVGHDLIWCLYCDWMTGIWSIGTEMLRNLESLWCPIRFQSDKKCDNCAIDFPDVNTHWVAFNGGMGAVADLLREHYPERPEQNQKGTDGVGGQWRPWMGSPARLTVNGEDPGPAQAEDKDDAPENPVD